MKITCKIDRDKKIAWGIFQSLTFTYFPPRGERRKMAAVVLALLLTVSLANGARYTPDWPSLGKQTGILSTKLSG